MIENKKRTYVGTITCTEAMGILGPQVIGSQAVLSVTLTGPGPEFIVEGEISAHVIAVGRALDGLRIEPVKVHYDEQSGSFRGNASGKDGAVDYEIKPSKDFKTMGIKSITGNFNNVVERMLLTDIKCSGMASLAKEEVIDVPANPPVNLPEEPPVNPPTNPPKSWSEHVYDLTVKVDNMDGLMSVRYENLTANIEMVIAGRNEQFLNPVGQTFTVSGKVKRLIDKDGKSIIGDLVGNDVMEPTQYKLESLQIHEAISNKNIEVSGEIDVSTDLNTIDSIRIQCSGKGIYGAWARNVIATGSGKLVNIREIDAPEMPNEPEEPDESEVGSGHSAEFDVARKSAGRLTFETSGITHLDTPNPVGFEYIFLTMLGDGFNRVLLMNVAGGGRSIRYFVDPGPMRMEVVSDNLPGWHTWDVEWGYGFIKFFLDGNQIGTTEGFHGTVKKIIVGGNNDARRNFKGTWRNFRIV